MQSSIEFGNRSLGHTEYKPLGWSIKDLRVPRNVHIVDLNDGLLPIIFSPYINQLHEEGIIDTRRLFSLYLIEDKKSQDNTDLLVSQEREDCTVINRINLLELESIYGDE